MSLPAYWTKEQRKYFAENQHLISTQGGPPGLERLGPLRRHARGESLSKSHKRFVVVPAGRRSGKTERAKRRLVKALLRAKGSDPAFFAGAPTRDQAKRIWWNDLKLMVPKALIKKVSESELIIQTIMNSELHVVGMDKPARIEGKSWDGGVLDEVANMKPGAWGENVRPALSDRNGWCWLIGVPEGRNHYYDLNQYALSGVDEDWESHAWFSSEVLPAKEVEAARRQLDPLVFQQEYEASFVNFVGRAYYTFNEQDHCAELRYFDRQPLHLCFDFNVDPGVCAISQEQRLPGQYERDAKGVMLLDKPIVGTGWIGEVYIPQNSSTPAVCRKILTDWGDHQGEVVCFGDATGGARGSAKVMGSDWDLIKLYLRAGFPDEGINGFGNRVSFNEVPVSNPAERARINAVNTRFKAGDGTIRMMVDPAECQHLVKDFEGVRLLEGGSGEIDKKYDTRLTHISDAAGYYVVKRFPIIPQALRPSTFRM